MEKRSTKTPQKGLGDQTGTPPPPDMKGGKDEGIKGKNGKLEDYKK